MTLPFVSLGFGEAWSFTLQYGFARGSSPRICKPSLALCQLSGMDVAAGALPGDARLGVCLSDAVVHPLRRVVVERADQRDFVDYAGVRGGRDRAGQPTQELSGGERCVPVSPFCGRGQVTVTLEPTEFCG